MLLNKDPEAMQRLRRKLQTIAPVPEVEFDRMAGMIHLWHLHKGEALLEEGEVCKRVVFIFKGCVRDFCLKDGKEVNVNFHFEDEIVCDFESFRDDTPSAFGITAMEDCIVYYMTKREAAPFFLNDTSLHILLFRFFQDLYLKEEEHSNSFKILSAEERYQYLLNNRPEYIQRIPVIHLASYLGISRETLNRIRKKLN